MRYLKESLGLHEGETHQPTASKLVISVIKGLGERPQQPSQTAQAKPSQPPPHCVLVLLGTNPVYVGTKLQRRQLKEHTTWT